MIYILVSFIDICASYFLDQSVNWSRKCPIVIHSGGHFPNNSPEPLVYYHVRQRQAANTHLKEASNREC